MFYRVDSNTLIHDSFKNVVNAVTKFGYNISNMQINVDTHPHYSNGNPVQKENIIWGSSLGDTGIIYVNPNYQEVMDYFKIHMSPDKWFTFIIGYQASKWLYKNVWKEKEKAAIYSKANNDKSFHSLYVDSLTGSVGSLINEETCCEYFANMICRSLGMK